MTLLPDYQIEALSQDSETVVAPLIEPFDPRRLQPASYDLTLERQFCFPEANNVPFASSEYRLLPGTFILGCTRERIWLPWDIAAEVSGRSGNARRGIQIEAAGHVDPGYCGVITLEIMNFGTSTVILGVGMGIAKIVFHTLTAPCRTPYNGGRNRHQYSHGPSPS